jgi:hypothetical protein
MKVSLSFVSLLLCSMALQASDRRGSQETRSKDLHANHAHHQEREHDHNARAPLPPGSETVIACRSGAFVEAASMLNSIVEIAMALPPNTPERTRAEVDVLLYTALKQAHSEVSCVTGTLKLGYDRSFAEIIERATMLAKSRGLKPEIISLGTTTSAALRASYSKPIGVK